MEDHYYPFGATITALSSTAPLSQPNQFKFNAGSELNPDFDINWYETPFRGYDAQLGKFMQVDPLADIITGITPYNYAYNNPIMFNDPMGLIGEEISDCPDCPDDPKYDSYRESDDLYIWDDELGPVLVSGSEYDVSARRPSTFNGFPWLERWFSWLPGESENSQRYGNHYYVTDGSGGPGSNTNGEVIDRRDMTGFSSLASGAVKMGPYQSNGGINWARAAKGIELADKIKKQFSNDGFSSSSNNSNASVLVNTVSERLRSQRTRSYSISLDTSYHINNTGDTTGRTIYPAIIDEKGIKSRTIITPRDSAEYNKFIRNNSNN